MRISFHILVGPAPDTIERCLNSVAFADEIVIVLDERNVLFTETARIIGKWHQQNPQHKVYCYGWENDSFADARNFALSKQTGDYIGCIDADEELQIRDYPILTKDVYHCRVRKDGSVFEFPRIFRSGIGLKYKSARHNQLEGDGRIYSEGKLKCLFNGLKETTPEELILKTQNLIKRHEKQLDEEPDNEALNYHLMQCHKTLGNWNECIYYGTLALTDRIGAGHWALVCLALYTAYCGLKKKYFPAKWLQMSLGYCPEQISAKVILYEEAFKAGDKTECEKLFNEINSTNSALPIDMSREFLDNLFKKYNYEKI